MDPTEVNVTENEHLHQQLEEGSPRNSGKKARHEDPLPAEMDGLETDEKLEMESQEASGASEKSPLKPDVELQDRELEHSVALSVLDDSKLLWRFDESRSLEFRERILRKCITLDPEWTGMTVFLFAEKGASRAPSARDAEAMFA